MKIAAVPKTDAAAAAAAASSADASPTVIPPAAKVVAVAKAPTKQLSGRRSPAAASPKVPTSPLIGASPSWPYQATEAGAYFDGPFL